ncbi:MAG: type II secretion system F family protein [Candidatus Aenigmarchaeota archaeon]|nr:type II secretion system F family protein [Candidatus Aenigmarchaeota archaeon]
MIYKFLPKRYLNRIRNKLELAGMKTKAEKYINIAFISSVAIGFLIAFLIKIYFYIVFIGVFCAMFLFFDAYLTLAIDKRKSFVENVLPDALELMAANIRAGFIPSRALLLSARKEFGPLADAIKRAGKEMMTGRALSESLISIPKYIKSEILEKTMKLIVEGVTSGGQLVALLEENALDIRRRQAIKKEVKANVIMYGIFIVFAGVFGAPILYALSLYLINTLSSLGSSSIGAGQVMSKNVPFFKGTITISPDFLFIFSIVSIMITTFFSGIIIGLIDTGKERGGIKYIPIFMTLALVVFFIANYLINSIFSSMLP